MEFPPRTFDICVQWAETIQISDTLRVSGLMSKGGKQSLHINRNLASGLGGLQSMESRIGHEGTPSLRSSPRCHNSSVGSDPSLIADSALSVFFSLLLFLLFWFIYCKLIFYDGLKCKLRMIYHDVLAKNRNHIQARDPFKHKRIITY